MAKRKATAAPQTDATMLRAGNAVGEEASSGQSIADRALAMSLIEYGRREDYAEALVVAAEILGRNPADPVNAAARRNGEGDVQAVLDEALSMRSSDRSLASFTRRTAEAVPSADVLQTRPRFWLVRIRPRSFYTLSPPPTFEAHRQARVSATTTSNVMIGISARRVDQRRPRRWVARRQVIAEWNPRLYTREWEVQVHNLSASETIEVRIEVS